MSNKFYTDESTQHISPREFTRKRPGTYCGSTEYSTQLVRELFANSLDEHNIGHGNLIKIEVNSKENIYTVTDNGQGFIPGVPRENGETMFSECFSVINTSGKYDDTDDSVYGGSALGLNGIGMKLVCYLSKWSQASTSDGSGKREIITYKDGIFENRQIVDEKRGCRGTSISYIPDEQFFQHREANFDELRKMFKDVSALCPTLTIELSIDNQVETFHSEHGLNDLIDTKVKDKEILSNRFIAHRESGSDLFDICLTYTSNYSEDVTSYVNYGLTESGVHLTALKTNLTRLINKYANDNNIFKKGETNLTGQELAEGLVIIFNLKAKKVAYDSQSKVRVVDIDKTLITETLSEDFASWLQNNPKDVKIIIDKAINARKAREAAKKAREAVRDNKKKDKGLKAKIALSNKFIDCISKDAKDRNLLLVEGLSAGSAAVEARNTKTDCIYMLRGKVISPLKTAVEKLLANQEINDIVKVIGGGFGANFDIDKINFDKIVITTDADSDGADIALLLLTFFFTYMRPLVEQGKLYRAVTPLYIVRKKNEELYFYSDTELEEWKAHNKGAYDLLRAKGLGELNAADLKKVCFEQQRFKRITVSDAEETVKLLNILQGSAVEPRKKFIYDNAHELGFNFD